MKPVLVTAEARADLVAAADWYESRSPGLGLEFVRSVEQVLTHIGEHPRMFPRWSADARFRLAFVGRFPYAVFDRETRLSITVVAVAHQRRRPGYWVRR